MMKLSAAPSTLNALPSALSGAPKQQRFTPNRNSLYGRRWRVASSGFLSINRYCLMCQARGERTRATVTDHLIPHKGDVNVFWNKIDWQPLCKADHDQTKQAIENKAGDDIGMLIELNRRAITVPGVPLGG